MDSAGQTNCNHWTTMRTAGRRSRSPNPTRCRCWSSVDSGGKPRDGAWRIMMEGRNDWRAPDFAVVPLSFQEGGRAPVVKLLCCWETPPGTLLPLTLKLELAGEFHLPQIWLANHIPATHAAIYGIFYNALRSKNHGRTIVANWKQSSKRNAGAGGAAPCPELAKA